MNWFTMSEQCVAEYQQMRWQWFLVLLVVFVGVGAFHAGRWLCRRCR